MRTKTVFRFETILSRSESHGPPHPAETAHDLALDQVFAGISQEAPRATQAFGRLLGSLDEVGYRQAVFRGLEDAPLRAAVEGFLKDAADCARRDEASAKAHTRFESELWHLRAVVVYVMAVEAFAERLVETLSASGITSEGWEGLARYVGEYRASPVFGALEAEALAIDDQLARLRYNALIRGGKVTIAATDDEPDLGAAVSEVFDRFRQGEVTDHRAAFRPAGLDHVQGWMLERAAQVHPAPFARLLQFSANTREYHDAVLDRFVDEVRFYLAYLDHLTPLRRAGLQVCYPAVTDQSKDLSVSNTWDLALASKLVTEGTPVVTNDLVLTGRERIAVISGPNQGGKTTMARIFGQVHYLAALGCPIPGTQAQVFLCDRVGTVFEREEQLDTLAGRLGAEIQRLHELFDVATSSSVIVINEAFASTALQDARILTRDVLQRLSELDALGVCVTFIDELSRLNDKTVSMVSTVDPNDPAVRTFRVERRVADGRAFAHALARKHDLTAEQIVAHLAAPADDSVDARGEVAS